MKDILFIIGIFLSFWVACFILLFVCTYSVQYIHYQFWGYPNGADFWGGYSQQGKFTGGNNTDYGPIGAGRVDLNERYI